MHAANAPEHCLCWPLHTLVLLAACCRHQVTISCLINQISDLPPEQRRIPLATIAARTKLSVDGVEFLLMKALALHLIEGSIDQVRVWFGLCCVLDGCHYADGCRVQGRRCKAMAPAGCTEHCIAVETYGLAVAYGAWRNRGVNLLLVQPPKCP